MSSHDRATSPPPPAPHRRTRMTAAQRRRQLLGVARALFAEKGYEAASVEELALRADVSKPVVYEHFGGKEGVYAVLVDREVEQLTGAIVASIEERGHPRTLVERAAMTLLTYVETNPDGFRLLLGETPAKRGAGLYSGLLGDVASEVEGMLAPHFAQRGFEPGWAVVYAQMLVGLVAQVGQWWLDDRSLSKEQVVAHVVNLSWNGLVGLERGTGEGSAPHGESGTGAPGDASAPVVGSTP